MLAYGSLLARTAQLAARLSSALVMTEGGVVGLCVEKSVEEVAGMVGIMRAGAAYVPLATESRELYGFMEVRYFGPQGRIGDILGQSEPGPAM